MKSSVQVLMLALSACLACSAGAQTLVLRLDITDPAEVLIEAEPFRNFAAFNDSTTSTDQGMTLRGVFSSPTAVDLALAGNLNPPGPCGQRVIGLVRGAQHDPDLNRDVRCLGLARQESGAASEEA